MAKRLFAILLVLGCVSRQTVTIDDSGLLSLEGTFSNIAVEGNGGLSGLQVRLFPGGDDFQFVVQFGQSQGLSRGIVGDARMGTDWPLGVPIPVIESSREQVAFSFSGFRTGSFEGYVYADRLEGQMQFVGESAQRIVLPRVLCDE